MIRRLAGAAVLLAAVTCADIAAAQAEQPTVEEIKAAEEAFSRGRESYKAGSFAEAAEHFERADNYAPNERVLELAIMSRDKAGHFDRAATIAQLGAVRHPDSERIQKLAEPLLTRAQSELLALTVECTEPCSLLDGSRLIHGEAAMKRLVYLTPGKHTIRAGWSHDRAISEKVEGAAGATATLTFTAPPMPKEPEQAQQAGGGAQGSAELDRGPREEPYGLSPLYFWIATGVTAAVGGVAVWSGVDTLNNPGKERIRSEPDREEAERLLDEGNKKELRTNILLGVAGGLAAGTIVLGVFFTDWSGRDEAAGRPSGKVAVSPWIGVGNGATIGATGRF